MNDKFLGRLETMFSRYNELEDLIARPEILRDNTLYTSYIKERGSLVKIVGKYNELNETLVRKKEAETILCDNYCDKDLYKLAREELDELMKKEDALFNEIKRIFLTEDKESMKNVIAEIRAGAGGEEAALFAADLFRMYAKFAEAHEWKVEIFDSSPTGIGGFKEIIFSIEGEGVYKNLRYESGTHRVQRVPTTESSGRIHTSTATVAILPEIEEVEIDINPNDLEIDTFRSSGPGGQKVNKTSSAVRITHKPSGLVVKCLDEKSQHKNKAKAMRILRSRLHDLMQGQKHDERARERKSQIGTGDRSEKIRTYNFPQNRVTDHRFHIDLYNLDNILEGRLDELIERLIKYDEDIKFKQLVEKG